MAHGLSCSEACGIFLEQGSNPCPCIGRWIFLVFNLFLNLFLAVLGLRCCKRAFSSCGKWRVLFIALCELLTEVTSLVAEHEL